MKKKSANSPFQRGTFCIRHNCINMQMKRHFIPPVTDNASIQVEKEYNASKLKEHLI